ncbi:MAG: DUF3306 domain-containing protein [Betaproteobacteria bacterium]
MNEDREPFLSRWSRRKVEAREEVAPPQREPEAAPVPAVAQEPPAPLPPVESLTTESDFKPFMAAEVAPETRRAALKKLFADARYNVHDPFEAYMEDYTKEDPIPLEMLKRLDHARSVLFEEPKPQAAATQAQAEAAAPHSDPQLDSKMDPLDGAAKQDA